MGYLAVAVDTPVMGGEVSAASCLFYAGTVFVYQTLDAIDGKQARRTKSGSPLGQLFDHGCDALNTWLMGVSMITVLRLEASLFSLAAFFFGTLMFFTSNWEEAQTNHMRFGVFSATEAQVTSILILLINAFFGSNFWLQEFWGICLNQLFVFILLLATSLSFLESVILVYHFYTRLDYRGEKTFIAALIEMLPIAWLFGFSMLAVAFDLPFYQKHARIFLAIFGILFAFLTTKLIIAHVSKSNYEHFEILTTLLLLAINNYFHVFNATLFAYSLLLLVAFIYLHYVFNIIFEITSFLEIRCFSIKRKIAHNKK